MDLKELGDAKRTMCLRITQEIREFEQNTGAQVGSIKINRDETGIESISAKVELPD